jgi:hypothetical protein
LPIANRGIHCAIAAWRIGSLDPAIWGLCEAPFGNAQLIHSAMTQEWPDWQLAIINGQVLSHLFQPSSPEDFFRF